MVQNTRDSNLLNTEWTQVASGVADVYVSLETRVAPVLIRVAESTPASGVDTGHTLTNLNPAMSFIGLTAAQKVYARAVVGSSKICIS